MVGTLPRRPLPDGCWMPAPPGFPAPIGVKKWCCVLPTALSEGRCDFFVKAEKVRMASGLNDLLGLMPSKKERSLLRLRLTDFFGSKGTYYRYKDGERLMNPQLQQQVLTIVQQYVPEAADCFDETFEAYDFTKKE